MKTDKRHLILFGISITSLVLLVLIQISWISRSANLQEKQFNSVMAIAMDRIAQKLSYHQHIGEEFYTCLHLTGSCARLRQNERIWSEINSLVRTELDNYDINMAFEFDIVPSGDTKTCPYSKQIHVRDDLEKVLEESGYELLIRFPEKGEFLRAQMGYVFISSIVLILLVTISFVMIFNIYKRQRRFSANVIDFVNNITHELKTPLTNIALANSMIGKNKAIASDNKLLSYSGVIKNEQQYLKEKVELLLKTSLFENGIRSDNQFFEALSEANEVAKSFSIQLSEKLGKIEVESAESSVMVFGNVELFNMVLGNLIDNAIKYNQTAPAITIAFHCIKDEVVIKVTDNGIGIPSKYFDSVFDKYFRVPTGDVHDNKGFGLGLFMVRQAVKAMKGSISVESKLGQGTTFTIKLQGKCK